jgi:hypothetical protein
MTESDEDLRVRIINAYGMWGAFCTVVLESSGDVLDELAATVGVERIKESV